MGAKNPALPERKCQNCGRVVRLNDNYCPSCGSLLTGGKPYAAGKKSDKKIHVDNPQCVISEPPSESHSRVIAALMAIFLGWLGLHNFYLGYYTRAVCQLVLAVIVGPLTFGLASVAVCIWSFIEGVLILANTAGYRTDARGVYLHD